MILSVSVGGPRSYASLTPWVALVHPHHLYGNPAVLLICFTLLPCDFTSLHAPHSSTPLLRVHLAKMMRNGGNLLMLDEPTNDLDVDTLRALEDAILSFAGRRLSVRCLAQGGCHLVGCMRKAWLLLWVLNKCVALESHYRIILERLLLITYLLPIESFCAGCVIVISHDRWFLDRIATHILAFEGDSKVRYMHPHQS